jgi:hypothetical protein
LKPLYSQQPDVPRACTDKKHSTFHVIFTALNFGKRFTFTGAGGMRVYAQNPCIALLCKRGVGVSVS